jgi:hypothetical protein
MTHADVLVLRRDPGFQAFLSMFPLLLGILAVVGLVLRNPQMQAPPYRPRFSAEPSESGA